MTARPDRYWVPGTKVRRHRETGGAGQRRMGRSAGFTLIELVLVVLLIGVLAGMLYKQVAYYQEQAEKAAMEQVAAAFRSGLQFRVAAYLLSRQPEELSQLNSENPADWLADKPSNYAGAFFGAPPPGSAKLGDWYYDLQNKTMVYTVWHRAHFRPGEDGYRIRFRARVDYGPISGADGRPLAVSGVRGAEFEPVSRYDWFE